MIKYLRFVRASSGEPTGGIVTNKERIPSPLSRKRKVGARKKNKVAAASRKRNR
jgi:hypothetical protein